MNLFRFPQTRHWRWLSLLTLMALLLSACQPGAALGYSDSVITPLIPAAQQDVEVLSNADRAAGVSVAAAAQATTTPPYPQRPRYSPGELVEYTAQTGDTLLGLAKRFNTTVDEILEANPFIPDSATTMPPGMPMQIPIYYMPLWGSPYQILPDSLFINGPAQVDFDTAHFVNSQPGWLKDYENYVADANRSGAEIVDYIAHYYSVSPRLLLAMLEYHAGALSEPEIDPELEEYPLGYHYWKYKGLFLQLVWAANLLNDGYYGYRTGHFDQLEHSDGRVERFDPWQNAATASLHNYFNTRYAFEDYVQVISEQGFILTYRDLFGDPWVNEQPHISGSLLQPEFILPFHPGDVWAMTGGPHTAWGVGEPMAALDFAPPSKTSGCVPSNRWATAVADGVVVRSGGGEVMLDLDGDGDERTGWNVFYLHIATKDRVPLGAELKQGDPIGHPSCEGGASTGTHIHIARKYNGEWMPAEGMCGGILSFNMEGWVAHNGSQAYLGTMTRNSQVVTACTCSNAASFIQSDRQPDSTK